MNTARRSRTTFRTAATHSMSMRRAWYAETEPSGTPPAQNPATPPETPGRTGDKPITQADIDRIVADRLKRDREAQQTKMLEALGVTSFDEAKTAMEAKRKADDAALSEAQKLQQQLATEQKKTADAIAARETLERQILDRDRKAEFVKAAQKGGGSAVEDLFILVQAKRGNDFAAVFGDGAIADEAKMTAFIKQVQADHPNYFGSAGAGSPSNSGGMSPTSQGAIEEAKKAVKEKFGKM